LDAKVKILKPIHGFHGCWGAAMPGCEDMAVLHSQPGPKPPLAPPVLTSLNPSRPWRSRAIVLKAILSQPPLPL
jgi:hypothetical protein